MTTRDPRYARYVLGVLVLVYVFNFLDRQILAILADRIRADLGVSDAQLGFLYGTAFAVFFAVFGIPLGRLADVWDRRRLIAWGLAAWSVMTALSGLAQSFPMLALARIGVGVGEASAAPAAYSLLADWFPPHQRATALAIYASGIYLGAGLGLGVGGFIVDRWDLAWATTAAPFGLRGWQVAFFVVGLPGLLLALWVRTLREPEREQEPVRPLAVFLRELTTIVPPFTVVQLARLGGGGAVARNFLVGVTIALGAWGITAAVGNPPQWIALGVGGFAAASWLQILALRDPPTYAALVHTPSFRWSALGFALLAFVGYGIGFWMPVFFMRVHGLDASQAGLRVGVISAAAGWLGSTCGGVLADRWRRVAPTGRLRVGMLCGALTPPLALVALSATDTTTALIASFPTILASSLWLGAGASTIQELVLPRMRGTAAGAYLLVVTFVGLALGPYMVGMLSTRFGDLRLALQCCLLAHGLAVVCFVVAARHLADDEANVVRHASAAGEAAT